MYIIKIEGLLNGNYFALANRLTTVSSNKERTLLQRNALDVIRIKFTYGRNVYIRSIISAD